MMRIAIAVALFAASFVLTGCTGGMSAEQQDREEVQEAAATQRAETFARSLPPAR